MSIKLSFLGAAQNVTGSRFLIETQKARVLVDCGLYQEREFRDRNWDKFFVPPGSIDAVLLTHGHLDHCGLLPKLGNEGFTGRVFCTEATAEIAPIVMYDSAHIQEEDARYKKKRLQEEKREPKHPIRPLYTEEDVDGIVANMAPVVLGEETEVAEGVQVVFQEAGHILGAATIRVVVNDGQRERSIVFSGDIGRWDRPILNDPDPFTSADYVVMESTYGDREHTDVTDTLEKLANIINETCDRGGNVIIPAFAIERSQEILYDLNLLRRDKKIPGLTVFLDSPMAVKVTEVFKKHAELYDEEMKALMADGSSPFTFDNLKLIRSRVESKAINAIRGCSIVMAGSGMCTGGRIKHHLLHNIKRPESTILFVGYQANGTLGRQIVEGAETVRILGREWPVRAQVAQLHGFSGHADKNELLRWLKTFGQTPKEVFVVHGGATVAQNFAKLATKTTGLKTSVPAYHDAVELD